jgi:ribosome recycling factor
MIEQILKETEQKMKKSAQVAHDEFATVRTGRASKSLVEGIKIDYYGVPTPLKQLANISVPEARLIIIQPWDPSVLESIEKTIMKSNLGLTPNNDGKMIRISVPQLTQERREDLIKVVKNIAEQGKVSIRSIRREANDRTKKAKSSGDISEDQEYKLHDKIQELTDRCSKEIDNLMENKEKEIREI